MKKQHLHCHTIGLCCTLDAEAGSRNSFVDVSTPRYLVKEWITKYFPLKEKQTCMYMYALHDSIEHLFENIWPIVAGLHKATSLDFIR